MCVRVSFRKTLVYEPTYMGGGGNSSLGQFPYNTCKVSTWSVDLQTSIVAHVISQIQFHIFLFKEMPQNCSEVQNV